MFFLLNSRESEV